MRKENGDKREDAVKRPSIADIQRISRETFRRKLNAAEAKACRRRLPGMVEDVRILEEWEGRLRNTEPAVVNVVPGVAEDQDDGC